MPKLLKSHLLVSLIVLFSISSCKKDNSSKSPGSSASDNDVYVVGSLGLMSSSPNSSTAVVWKNGVATQLGTGPVATDAYGIAVHNNDVYVVGNGFWKNGVSTPLSFPPSESCSLTAITINGNDIYISGSCLDKSGNENATYWINGVPHACANSTSAANSFASGIAVYGSDVYVSGYTRGGSFDNIPARAAYWKNGVYNKLTGSASEINSYAECIAVDGSGIYVTGTSEDASDFHATYWKNAAVSFLPDSHFAYSITKENNSLYVILGGQGAYTGAVWKDGVSTNLGGTDTFAAGEASTYAGGMFVNGSDVYVAGNSFDPSGLEVASYWKNGTRVLLSDKVSQAHAVLVVPHN